jgi:hypothetical protein
MKKTIGRIDKADFPDLHLEGIAVKIDTGAYTSSIHCNNIHEEGEVLKCAFLDEEHPNYNHKTFTFTEYKLIKVRSSNGLVQKRYEVKTRISLFGKTHKISLSLSDRKEMRYPVLLGRKFLNKKFIVDPQLTNVSFNANKK